MHISHIIEDNNVSGYYNQKHNMMNNLVPGISNFGDAHQKITSDNIILVYKIDRLGRNSVSIENLLQGWQNQDIEFHSVLENVSYKTEQPENFAMNKIIIDQVRLAQEESDKKSRDLKKRHQLAKSAGKSMGGTASFGFKKKDKHKIINFTEQKIIKYIIKQFKTLGSETDQYGSPITIEKISDKLCNKMNNSTKYKNRIGTWRKKRVIDLFNTFKSDKKYLNAKNPEKKTNTQSSDTASSSSSSNNSNSYYYQQKDQESTQEIHSRLKALEEQLKTMRQNETINNSSINDTIQEEEAEEPAASMFSSFFG